MTGMMDGLGGFVGPIVASVLLVTAGPAAVVGVMALFAVCAALLSCDLELHAVVLAAKADSLVADALEGFRELRTEPGAALLVGIDGVQYFLFGLLDVLYALLAIEILAVGTSGTGVLAASFGVGGLVGAGIAVGLAGVASGSPHRWSWRSSSAVAR